MLASDCAFHLLPDITVPLADGGRAWLGGYCRFTKPWTNHPHRHPNHHELCLVLAGTGAFVHGPDTIQVTTGSLFVSDLQTMHEIRSPDTRDLCLIFIAWAPGPHRQALADDPQLAPLAAFTAGHRIHRPGQEHLALVLPALHAESGDPDQDAWRRGALLHALLTAGFGALARHPTPPVTTPAPLLAAQRYLRAHLGDSFPVAEMAAAAGIGERQLRRLFRRHLGCGIVAAITAERLRQAARLLLMHFPVAVTAQRVGIASVAQFCRLFKRRYGLSPGAWQSRQAPRQTLPTTEYDPP